MARRWRLGLGRTRGARAGARQAAEDAPGEAAEACATARQNKTKAKEAMSYRPNAAKPETPPGAVVRQGGPGYTPVPAWRPYDWPGQREETRARRAEERAARRKVA